MLELSGPGSTESLRGLPIYRGSPSHPFPRCPRDASLTASIPLSGLVWIDHCLPTVFTVTPFQSIRKSSSGSQTHLRFASKTHPFTASPSASDIYPKRPATIELLTIGSPSAALDIKASILSFMTSWVSGHPERSWKQRTNPSHNLGSSFIPTRSHRRIFSSRIACLHNKKCHRRSGWNAN